MFFGRVSTFFLTRINDTPPKVESCARCYTRTTRSSTPRPTRFFWSFPTLFFHYSRCNDATPPNLGSRSLFNVYDLADTFTADYVFFGR
jgi:hypothetical protein